MKKRLQGLIVGALIGAMLTGGTVFAISKTQKIEVLYDNIKILIDGVAYTPKDADGNVVEPFIYNGTTYLPVRGIANAFGVPVNWDNKNSAVELGYSKVDYLSQLSYVDYTTNQDTAEFSVHDTYNLKFKLNWKFDELATQILTYKLHEDYKNFKCDLKGIGGNGPGCYVNFYGNNKQLLYSSPCMNDTSTEIPIVFDVKDQKILYIEIVNAAGESEGAVILKNAKLVK